MAKVDVWMPLYVGDWDLSTGHLTNEQDGAYGRLVRWYWKMGRAPPDNDAALASIVRTDVKTWRKVLRPALIEFFTIGDGVWRHEKVEAIIVEWSAKRDMAAERASKAAKKRWKNAKAPAKTDAPSIAPRTKQAVLEQCPSAKAEAPSTKGASRLENEGPVLPHGGQPTIVLVQPEKETLEERRRVAAEGKAALGIKTGRR